MATPSYKWYQTSVLAWMWNEEAIQQSWSEVPWYNMFSTGTQTTTKDNSDAWTKDREVEVWLWKKLVQPMSDMEKTEYINSLTDDQYRQMQKYKNEWYSFEASRTLLENSDWLKNPTARWTDKYRPKSSVFKDIVWWAYDSVTWLPRFLSDNLAKVVWWTAKKLWADEDKVNYLVQDFIDFWKNEMSAKWMWADTEGATYKITKWVWDLAQVAAWEWLAKNALKWTQALNKINQVKQSWLLGKMAVWAAEWAADMWLYNIISESELPSGEDLALGAWIWAIVPLAWVWLKAAWKVVKKGAWKIASKLELSWMLNPSKIERVKNMLIDEWTDLVWAWLKGWTAEDVWNWMIQRGMKGTKEEIITQLWEHSKNARGLKLKALAKSTTTHNVEAADWMLKAIDDVIKDVPWLEQKSARVQELMSKKWQYTLAELDEIKSIWDDILDLYTNAWEPKAWAVKKWLVNLRNNLKTYIEKAATEEWLWNIKMLNNEIQVAKALEKWISAKDSADMAREMLSIFSKGTIWWAIWAYKWPFDSDTLWWRIGNVLIWALAWQVLFSTKAKTNLAAMIDKRISKWARVELEQWLGWEVKALSKKTEQELFKILQDVEATPIEVLWNGTLTSEEAEAIFNYIQPSLFE